MAKKINTRDVVQKIHKLARERMLKQEVVDIKQLRDFKNKSQPQVALVIEDDEMMRKSLRRIVEELGLQAKIAADGSDLSLVLDDQPIDIIILDIGLPWINGLELARLLKENDDLKNIPLIFISGMTSDMDIKRGFAAGADDYIKKPFEIETVKKSIRTLLELRKS